MKIKIQFILSTSIFLILHPAGAQTNKTSSHDLHGVMIGEQEWSARNLEVSEFENGEPIQEAKTKEEWMSAAREMRPAWCYYNNDPATGGVYGKLYNWYAVHDPRGLAPRGWWIARDAEWKELGDYLGGVLTAGGLMKNISGWNNNGNGNNKSGFSGLPGGVRTDTGKFDGIGRFGDWWSSSESDPARVWVRSLIYVNGNLNSNALGKGFGLSVRCIRD